MENKDSNNTPKVVYGVLPTIVYYAFSFLDGYDAQTLSVCFRAFEMSLELSPSTLSFLATVELMSILGFAPPWGFIADRFENNHVLTFATVTSGVVCILIGVASNYSFILFLRLLHGFSLAATVPMVQKIITDSTTAAVRGVAFGKYHSIACLGRLISALVTTVVSMQVIFGFYGWRVSYVIVGIVWIFTSVFVFLFMKPTSVNKDPKEIDAEKGETNSLSEVTMTLKSKIISGWGTIKQIMSTRTSWIALLAVYISDAPFGAFVYLIMYFQYEGLSDFIAGVGCATTLIGGVIGGYALGRLIDSCHKKNEKYGRLIIGTAIMVTRLVVVLTFFLGPKVDGSLEWHHYIGLAILGATLVTVSSIDRTVMADVVPDNHQAFAFSLIRALAGIPSSATFLPLCGFLAERSFGYIKTDQFVKDMDSVTRITNATALSKSIICVIGGGTIINILLYLLFFITYPTDSMKFKKESKELTVVPS